MKCIYKHLKGFCTYIYPQHSLGVLSCFDTLRKLCSRSQQHQSREGSTFHWDTCWLTSECTEKPHKYAEQRGAAFQRAWTLILQRQHRHVNCDARIGYRPHMPWSNLLGLFADNISRILHLENFAPSKGKCCLCVWMEANPPCPKPFSVFGRLTHLLLLNKQFMMTGSHLCYFLLFHSVQCKIVTTINLPPTKWVWYRTRHGGEAKRENHHQSSHCHIGC